MRLAVVTPHPTPYRDPFWNEVAAQPGVSLDVFYCTDRQADLPWTPSWEMRYRAEALPVINLAAKLGRPGFIYWNPAITARLSQGGYDAIIVGGYNHPTLVQAMRVARRMRIPYFLMSESYLGQPRSSWRRVVKTPFVRWAVTGAAGCFPTGTWARDYLVHYGASPERCWMVPNVPDLAALGHRADTLREQRSNLRGRHGYGSEPVVLYVGRLVPFKRVDILIEAFATIAAGGPCSLAIVGDGDLRGALEDQAARAGLRDRVRFVGFTAPDEVPEWYALADVLALPSVGETWSATLIEALASNLPVVTTSLVGAAADVVNDPLVGTIVPPADAEALAGALQARISRPVTRDDVRRVWSPQRDALRHDVIARRMVNAIASLAG